MKAVIIDGYVDEPGSLGVPPFIHPMVRAAYGAAIDAGCGAEMITIDHVRRNEPIPRADHYLILSGSAVPGRYIRAMPASLKEVLSLAERLPGRIVLGGPAALEHIDLTRFDAATDKDPASALYDIITTDGWRPRWRTSEEWERWLMLGSESVVHHPDYPQPLIAEVETYRGCVRYRSGGCSFCVEPLKGRPVFRAPEDIIKEVTKLHELGVRNFRLGSQTCIVSYMAHLDGTDVPRPNPEAVERLLSGIAELGVDVLHLDNANPAIIATYPEESRKILRSMAEHCTSGNVLALGLESADPRVHEMNNLNATAEQTLEAIRLINEIGRERGPSGLPKLLPGVNFVIGLDGESEETLALDLEFLRGLVAEDLLVRRINIRQVSSIRRKFDDGVNHGKFLRFKETVRKEIDHEMLRRLVPQGTVLRDVYLEMVEGKVTFGRQIGTYPLLVGIEHPLPLEHFIDVKITNWGYRSITGVEYPLHINHCPIGAIESLPGVGRKRAMRLFRARTFGGEVDFIKAMDDEKLARELLDYIVFD